MKKPVKYLGVALLTLALCAAAKAGEAPEQVYAGVPAGAYSVVAEIRAKSGKEDELRAITLPLIALVRSDPKNIVYFLQEDRESKGHFIFYEIFASQADFEAHNRMPYVKEWFAKIRDLALGGVQATRMEVLSAPSQ
jgi:quinol monooxygenase YgiN